MTASQDPPDSTTEVPMDELAQMPARGDDGNEPRDDDKEASEEEIERPAPKPSAPKESDKLLEEMAAEVAAGRYDSAKKYVEKVALARAETVAKEKQARKARRKSGGAALVPADVVTPSIPQAPEKPVVTTGEPDEEEARAVPPPEPDPPALSLPTFMLERDPSFDPTPPTSNPPRSEDVASAAPPPAPSSQPGNVTFMQMPVVEFGSDGLPFLRTEGAPPSPGARSQSAAGLPFKQKPELSDDTFDESRTTPPPPNFLDEPSTLPPGIRGPALPFQDNPETLPVGTRAPVLPFVGKSDRQSTAQAPVEVDRLAGTPFRGVTPWTERITIDQYAWLCSIELSGTFDVGDACATLSIQRSDLRELHEAWRSWIAADRERASQFEGILSRFTRKL